MHACLHVSVSVCVTLASQTGRAMPTQNFFFAFGGEGGGSLSPLVAFVCLFFKLLEKEFKVLKIGTPTGDVV